MGVGAITIGVVGRGGATAGVVGLDGACDGCATECTLGNGLFLFPGDRRCGVTSRVGGTSVTGALAEGIMREVGPGDAGEDKTENDRNEAFESVRTCAGAALPRWDVGRRGEGRVGWVLFNPRLETTRNLEPGRGGSEDCKGGRAEGAVLDDGEDGPGDDKTESSASCEREEEGRDAGSAGSWLGGESGWEPDSLSVAVCSGVGDGVGSAWTSSAGTLVMTTGLDSATALFGCVDCTDAWIALGVVGEGEGEGEGEDRGNGAEGATGDGERGGWRYWL